MAEFTFKTVNVYMSVNNKQKKFEFLEMCFLRCPKFESV